MGRFFEITFWLSLGLFILFLIVGLPLILVFAVNNPKDPTFSVDSTAVKAYNLTVDNGLFCIINVGIRARNPNSKKHTIKFSSVDMEVRKGKHHGLANDALQDFRLGPGGEAALAVEAVGLRVDVKKKIARELTADVVAGEGRVNVFMTGSVGSNILGVTCNNVAVDFSKSTVIAQKVDCKVSVTNPNSG